MKITITPTKHLVKMPGGEARLWEGVTSAGTPCKVFVRLIAVHNNDRQEEFERELEEQLPPGEVIDLRYVM